MTVEPMPAIEPVTDEDVYFARMRAPRAGSGLSNDDFQNILEQDRRRVAERQAPEIERLRAENQSLHALVGTVRDTLGLRAINVADIDCEAHSRDIGAEVAKLRAAQANMIDATGAVETGVFWYSGRYVGEIPKSMALSRVLIVRVP